jgi:hypothetical protein
MMQDLQIILGAEPLVAVGTEVVVGHAEPRRREQIVAVSVLGECARLADQRVDDVPVVDGVPIAAHQPRPRLDTPVRVPDFDAIGIKPGLDLLADQPTVHRVDVAMNVNQASAVHAARHLQTGRQPRFGQVSQQPQLLGKTVLATGVPRLHHLLQETRVHFAVGELPAAAEKQRLIDGALKVSVRRLGVAVLVRLPRVDPLPRYPVVSQQISITRLEFPSRGMVVHSGGQRVAAVPMRHAAQFPEGILQSVRKRLERFRRTHRHRLPVRVGQHEVVDHVIEWLAGDGDVQGVHVGEVGGREVAGLVDLAEHDGLAGTVSGPPLPHPAFEGPAMRIEELAGMLAPEPVEERLGEQSRLGCKPRLDCRPNGDERIGPGAVGPRQTRRLPRAGQRAVIAVLTGGLVAHACSPGRRGQGCS